MASNSRSPDGAPASGDEAAAFAPALRRVRALLERRAPPAAARRDPAMDAGEAGAGAGVLGATTASEPVDAAYETQPAGHVLAHARVPGAVVAVLALAVAGLLAGLGWVASRPPSGVPELTPGVPAGGAATKPVKPPPVQKVRPAAPARTPRAPAPAAPRVRPETDYSAMDTGAKATAAAPMIAPPTAAPPPAPPASAEPERPAATAPTSATAEPGAPPPGAAPPATTTP
jgi:hypothetical protein